jgi:hypothetical protein
MTLAHSMTDEAAGLLYAAQEGWEPIEPLSQRFSGLNAADPYAIRAVIGSTNKPQHLSRLGWRADSPPSVSSICRIAGVVEPHMRPS